MRINNNIMAMNTHRQYSINNANISKSIEKLSSGYRINRAGDDAAGLAISEKMRAQIRGLQMASKNSQDAISLVQTAEGALQTAHDILQRMRELAVQSASDTNETTIDRGALEQEFQQLIEELNDQANKTRFNDQNLIDGTFQKASTELAKAGGFASMVKDADGNITSTNVHYTKETAAGTYTYTLAVDNTETASAVAGVAPTQFSSNIGGGNIVTKLELDFSSIDGGGFVDDNGDVVAWTPDEGDAISFAITQKADDPNQFEVTFTLTNGAGTETATFTALAEFDPDAKTLTIGGEAAQGIAFDIELNTSADFTVAELNTALQDLAATTTAALDSDTKVDLAKAQIINATWNDDAAIANLTGEYNGVYTLSVTGETDNATITVTNAAGETVYSFDSLDLSSAADGDEYTVDLGALGTITLGVADPNTVGATVDDLKAALDGKYITVGGGSNAVAAQVDYSAKITDANGKEVGTVKVGDTSFTTADGIMIKFDRAITEADMASDDKLQAFLGGSLTAEVKIDAKAGKDMVIQTGANEGDNLAINIDRMDAWNLGVDLSSISDRESASKAITQVNDAINQVSTQRAALGALQNRLDYKIASLDISAENLQAAESRIRDLDMAQEMTNFTKNNILAQAATAMLAQANALPQGVLSLLQ